MEDPLPVILFAHGYQAGGEYMIPYYGDIMSALASWGNIVVGPRACPEELCWVDYAGDMERALDFVFSQTEDKILSKADRSRIGIIGHSMGGDVIVRLASRSSFLNKYSPRGAVAVAPASEYDILTKPSNIKMPVFFTTGTADTICPAQGVITAYTADPLQDKILVNAIGVEHNNIGYHGSQILNPYMVQYLECRVKGKQEACDYFTDSSNPAYLCNNGKVEFEICEIGPIIS